jgi:DNA-binding MarR family transcriptional regulator
MDDRDLLERAIAQLLRLNASRSVHARFSAAAGVVLSQPAAVLLRRIADHGPLTMGGAAAIAHMDPGATGRQIRELEQQGLVATERNPDDGRGTVVRATKAGLSVTKRLVKVWHQHMEDALSGWSKADRTSLARLLARFVDDLRSIRYRAAADGTTE